MSNSYKKILEIFEVLEEIRQAEADHRDADFSNSTIQGINLSEQNIRCGLNFKNSIILGNLYFNKTKIKGDLILENAIINGTLFLGEANIDGNLNAQRLSTKNSCNIIGAIIKKEINMRRMNVQGFLSLNKCFVGLDMNAEDIKLVDLTEQSGVIRGDFYAQKMEIRGSLNLTNGLVSGVADLSYLNAGNKIIMDKLDIQGILIMNKTFAGSGISDKGLTCQERKVNI
jgi:cytoskeletal protein CcmA (bactofilin family)